MTGCSVRRWQCACGACVCVASAGCDRKWSQKWRLGFPFCRAHSAVVARPLCKRKAPGSIPGVSNSLFDSPPLARAPTRLPATAPNAAALCSAYSRSSQPKADQLSALSCQPRTPTHKIVSMASTPSVQCIATPAGLTTGCSVYLTWTRVCDPDKRRISVRGMVVAVGWWCCLRRPFGRDRRMTGCSVRRWQCACGACV
ncbi:hypothetical protein PF010_g32389 [Phytophthora fragariae]|uniref:Uncharacterized protein n=2 Tax=Phytophthora TaxID=4783 RepID=A0A6G0JEM5_9STRA|nr:hypothetical protein PF010_g32389 [Phytophthora fragariae]